MRRWLLILLMFALIVIPRPHSVKAQAGEEPIYLGAAGHNLYVTPILGDHPGLLTFRGPEERGFPALFAWLDDGRWHSLPVSLDGLVGYPTRGAALWQDGSPVLLLGMEGQGSGGFGQLAQAGLDMAGGLRATPLTDVTEKVQFDFLEPRLILQTYRGSIYSPTAWNCNACWPVNDQKLLRWENGRVQVLGERVMSTPCFTATRFLGLLHAGDDEGAAQFAYNRRVLQQARNVLGVDSKAPFAWRTEDCWHAGGAGDAIGELERRNWDLIPPVYRTPLPNDMQHFDLTLKRGGDEAILRMVRRPDGWVVTEVRETKGDAASLRIVRLSG